MRQARCWHNEEQCDGDLPVQSTTCGHAACKATDPGLLEIRNAEDVGGDDSHRVRRVHKEPVLAQNHVPILGKKKGSM